MHAIIKNYHLENDFVTFDLEIDNFKKSIELRRGQYNSVNSNIPTNDLEYEIKYLFNERLAKSVGDFIRSQIDIVLGVLEVV